MDQINEDRPQGDLKLRQAGGAKKSVTKRTQF